MQEKQICYEPTPTPPPPPVLTLAFGCDVWGVNDWCRAGGRLRVTGEDPSGGQVQVTGTLGDPGNTSLTCQGQGTCTVEVPLPEGQGTAQATATSAYGQAQGSQAWQYDPTPPDMTYRLNPAAPDGQNGWYVTPPQVTVQGNDATSGVATLRVSADGGATWHASPWTVPDGQHTLLVQAVDGAGNITQAQVGVKVDTTPPQVDYDVPAPTGNEGWHVAPVTVRVGGQDATSGVAGAWVSVDGGPWQAGEATLDQDGVYEVRFRARDAAGNEAQAGPVTVKVDVTPPQVQWGAEWDAPLGCAPTLTGSITDGAGSGVAGAALSWDGGQTWQALDLDADGRWQVQPDLRSWAEGQYEAQVRVWDGAGRQATYRKAFTVAHPAPHIVVAPLGKGARWDFWEILRFEVRTTCLPISRMRIVVEGPEANRTETWATGSWPGPGADGSRPAVYAVEWRWDTAWDDGRYAHPGEYPVRFEAWDAWGRKWMDLGWLVVPVMSGPSPTPEPLPPATATPTAGMATATPTALAGGFVPPTPRATFTPGPTPTPRPLGVVATATPVPTATAVPAHTGLVGQAPSWAKTVVVGALFAGVVAAWLALAWRVARRRVTTVRPVSRWEAMRRAWAGWRLWGAKRRQAEPSNSQAVRVQRQRERVRWLRQWLRWEAGLQARNQARAAGAGKEPQPPPPPPAGTPERREWEERYAQPPREGMPLAEWKQYDNGQLARYERQQANQAFSATPARMEARGGYTLSPSPSPLQRLWHAITHPGETAQNALIALGRRSPLVKKAIEATAEVLWSLNDPQRNPVVAGLGEALRQGWAGLTFAARTTRDLARETFRAWKEGEKEQARRYGRALWQGLWEGWVKQSVRAIGHLVVQAINPLAWWETVETWWQTVQDWRAGKRGLWDVVFTTANVAALVLGLYMGGRALYRQVAPRLAAGTVVEMESRAAGAVVVGEGVSDEAARLAAQYGDEAARLAAQYGDDVLRLVEQYGDEGLRLVETYGDDALRVWTRYGHEGLQVLEVHGRPAVALLDDFGEQALEVFRRAVPDTSESSWKNFIPENYQDQVVGAFDGPGYAVRLQEDLIVYRYWGDNLGTNLWFTMNPNLTPTEARALLALPNSNTAIHVTEFRIPKGTTIIIGKVAGQTTADWAGPYAVGGGFQIYLPKPEKAVLVKHLR